MPYANSADSDQTTQSDKGLHCLAFHYTVWHFTKYFKKQLHKKAKFRPKKYGIKCSSLRTFTVQPFERLLFNLKRSKIEIK